MALILGIETTCDETAVALVRDGREVLSSVVASQVAAHAPFRGVVPEIASRAHVELILPTLRHALEQAGVELEAVEAVAVANRPGLIGSLLVGVTAAKTLAWTLGVPLLGVNHIRAHLYSVALNRKEQPAFPAVGLVVSGGHTSLYRVDSWQRIELLGSTIDDAVGEAYDKAAAQLGLGYPGGPVIDRLAGQAVGSERTFPRPLLGPKSLDFSFSGLKTAVRYAVHGVPGAGEVPRPLDQARLARLCGDFQAACVDVLVEKLRRASRLVRAESWIVGGGVSANLGLREALQREGVRVFLPEVRFCTDNAAMIAGLASVELGSAGAAGLDLDAIPSGSAEE
jgi:N6-L-threonylcarbamoyladenine synthase